MTEPARFWKICVEEVMKKLGHKKPEPEDLDTVAYLYESVGGEWEALASGVPDEWTRLRKVCKTFLKSKKS